MDLWLGIVKSNSNIDAFSNQCQPTLDKLFHNFGLLCSYRYMNCSVIILFYIMLILLIDKIIFLTENEHCHFGKNHIEIPAIQGVAIIAM